MVIVNVAIGLVVKWDKETQVVPVSIVLDAHVGGHTGKQILGTDSQ